MTQQLHDEQVDPLDYPDTVKSDLLSLRAAVRRVHDAEDNIKAYQDYAIEHARKHPLALSEGLIEMRRVRSAEAAHKAALVGLRAEMAGIDGKEQKP